MKKLKSILLSLALIGVFTFTSCEKEAEEEPKTIVDLAVDNGFNVLAAALTEAGLVGTLQGEGPFTSQSLHLLMPPLLSFIPALV